MKKNYYMRVAAACGLSFTLLAGASIASAANDSAATEQSNVRAPWSQTDGRFGGAQNGQMTGAPGQTQSAQSTASEPSEIVSGLVSNSAASLTPDYANAVTYDMSESGSVKIDEAGTYIITGVCANGSVTVKKGTTGVVLVLKELDLSSSEGAPLSVNKGAEAQIIISGSVTLTDNENPDDENSSDADVADAFDGAAIKIKAGASVYITGDGSLTLNGNAKNGVKAGDETALVFDGPSVTVSAANDAINGNYDVAILSGSVTVNAGDDGVHADRILTIGSESSSPVVTIETSCEGLEATVVNIAGGTVTVNASDDGVNAANSDGTYADELTYAINMTGGSLRVKTTADGLDSNGDINLVAGSASISSVYIGGDAGIDYDGQFYLSDEFELDNQSGVAGPDGMGGGRMGGMPGGMTPQNGQSAQNGQMTPPARGRQEQQSTAQSTEEDSQQSTAQEPQAPAQQGEQSFPWAPQGRFPMQGQQNPQQNPQGQQGQQNWQGQQNPQGQQGQQGQQPPQQSQQNPQQGPQGQQGQQNWQGQQNPQGQQGQSPMRGQRQCPLCGRAC